MAIEVEVIFIPAAKPKRYMADNVYTKGDMLCIREGEWIWKYPLIHVFSVCHKHGPHWGSEAHKQTMFSETEKPESQIQEVAGHDDFGRSD